MNVLLGYEVGSGAPVEIPVAHLAVTGQTQQSGKTTTLEALIQRSGLRAIAFVTKRAEGVFTNVRRVAPYFRERADWPFVASLLEATMREKMRFERAWIMRVSKGAKTLHDVDRNITRAMEKAKGLSADVYLTLHEYLSLVLPQIERLPYKDTIELQPGINVMDLQEYSHELQALVICSVLEWVYKNGRATVVIIPEAWEYVPQGRGSPVKLAAEQLSRKGAGAANFIWLDSQDLAGVDKVMLRAASVWILGVQREANEVKRTLANMPAGQKKPNATQVMTLGRGEFFASYGRELKRVYVQPAWMNEDAARAIARASEDERAAVMQSFANIASVRTVHGSMQKAGLERVATIATRVDPLHAIAEQREGDEVYKEEAERYRAELDAIKKLLGVGTHSEIRPTIQNLLHAKLQAPPSPSNGSGHVDVDALYNVIRDRLAGEAPSLLRIAAERPEIEVTVQKRVLNADASSMRGRLALMLADGFFDQATEVQEVYYELKKYNLVRAKENTGRTSAELVNLVNDGFLLRESQTKFIAAPGVKKNVRAREVAA